MQTPEVVRPLSLTMHFITFVDAVLSGTHTQLRESCQNDSFYVFFLCAMCKHHFIQSPNERRRISRVVVE